MHSAQHTGQETHKAYYCRHCEYQTAARPLGWAQSSRCPYCEAPLYYVIFSADEQLEAERLVGRPLKMVDK